MFVIRQVLSVRYKAYLQKQLISSTNSLCTTVSADPNVLKSESSDVIVPDLTLCELIYPKLELYHKYIAAECATTGRKYTFGQIRMKSRNFSKALRTKLKLKKGEVVAILTKNVPEFWIVVFGILEAGLVVTTLNPAYTADEIKKQLLDSGARAIITQVDTFSNVKSGLEMMNSRMPIMVFKEKQADSLPTGAINFLEFTDTVIDVPDIEPGHTSDLAVLPYSSGTTGLPKGVELTHNNIVANIMQANHEDFCFLRPPTDNFQDVLPGVLPLYHIYGFTVCMMSGTYNGVKTVTIDKFTPELYISVLKNQPVSIIYAAPPLILFLTTHADAKKEYFKLTRMVLSGAAPLGYLDEQRFIDKVGQHVKITQGYGLTETSPLVTWFPKTAVSSEKNGGSIGKLACNTFIKIIAPDDPKGRDKLQKVGDLRISTGRPWGSPCMIFGLLFWISQNIVNGYLMDIHQMSMCCMGCYPNSVLGTPLGMNQSGELLIKGPQVMRGYHNKPEETKNAFLDGWFRSGDLAHYNDEGFLFITDRLKELIKVKGFQVAPAELEELLRSSPGVEDAAVVGIPHSIYGEVPRAYVVPKKGASLNIDDLKEHVAQKVAKYKQLAGGVRIMDAIPKNPSGKILRRLLKDNYEKQGI